MPRNWTEIERAAQLSAEVVAQSNTLSAPPGYIQGFTVTLRKDYTVLISGGAANVQGKMVRPDEHQLTQDDWVAPRLDTPQHYFIYLTADGSIYVDLVKPTFDSFYGYYSQPDTGWRALGRLYVQSNLIIFASPVVYAGGSR